MASTELAYKFPETEQELNKAAQGFAALSSHVALKGCVACLDGYLLQIKVPSKAETGNVKTYLSGHDQTYGINMQAHVTINADLCMLHFLHLVTQNILLHIGNKLQ